MDRNTVEVCFTPHSFPLFFNENAIVVVIDVFRATSAICTAFHHGIEHIIPVATIEEAMEYKAMGYLAAAERHGEVVSGFELGNSPFSYMAEGIRGKTIALTTTNGTQAIEVSKDAYQVVIGSFLNLSILSEWLAEQQRDVILLCAGWKNKFNLEDTILAGAIAQNLVQSGNFDTSCDSTLAAQRLYQMAKNDLYTFLENSSHRKRLDRLDLDKDIRYCLVPDQAPVIPILEGKSLVRLAY